MTLNISAWSIRNPIFTLVLFFVLTVAGIVSFGSLSINENPNVDVPTVAVTITRAGAAPAELETEVTKKVEDAIAGIGNVDHIRSTINDGISKTTVEFVLDTNTDRAVNDVRDAIAKIRQQLPQDIDEPIISRVDFVGGPILIYSVASPSLTLEQLSWVVDNEVSRTLLSIKGISQVQRLGGVDREVQVNLEPSRLTALGITVDEVNRQLHALNLNLPGGRGNLGTQEQSIRTLGSALSVEQLRRTEISLPNGRKARLAELGSIEDGTKEPRQLARLDREPVVAFSIVRATGSSEVTLEKEVQDKVAELEKQFSHVQFKLILTTVRFARASYDASIEALLLGAALAVIVIYIFLKDWRSTVIAGLAIPLSIIPTFAVMQWFNFSLNNLSLLALALVVGILVDDAIVEIENIVRHIKQGKSPFRAAIDAADEIGLAVVATTMTIVAVFLPVGFMGGIPGQFFGQFGFTVVVSVLFSLLVARTVTPLMAAYFLRNHHNKSENRSFLVKGYTAILSWALKHRFYTLLFAITIFLVSLLLAPMIPSGFIPTSDRGQSILMVELPPGSKLEETDKTTQIITRLLKQRPEVENVFVAIGSLGAVNQATVFVNLKPREHRALSQQDFEQQISPMLAQVPGARMSFSVGFRGGKEVSIILTGDNSTQLNQVAEALTSQMQALPILANVSSTASLLRPEIVIQPRFDRAADQGVSVEQIGNTAKIATLGDIDAKLPKFNLSDRQVPIHVQLDPRFRNKLQTIQNLRVIGNDGKAVPLEAVADVSVGSGSSQIDRYDRNRQISVEANLNGVPLGAALNQIYSLSALKHLPSSIHLHHSGDVDLQDQVSLRFGKALTTGILFIYAVLVLLFGNLFHPLTIMVALPLSLGGALGGLLITGKALVVPALIGMFMLMGIVTKNSILLVEYTLTLMKETRLTRHEALLEAGATRFRPILMTTLAMIAGMLPLVASIGADAEARSPMAVAVVGGLLTSTLLTLVVIPVVFTYVDNLQVSITRIWSKIVGGGGREQSARSI
ncbi:efflux RND transporter permease subunit [Aetokthonos hydrillicola Thurmond2011]|jgi:hydrophobe/amphiphile efflux-1 (HAE1) family protein|uniref:Efflux RND transporter permease subunit n=1 Tax=Aetokthonos hydrillicola Thurmond2011 TaxID=2712845 RepID=A0AAP5IB68_9CYAN|nr:efflux RND transporter permease subunit [Aetokthonos hydrillicola]MBO3459177.1 efflux RND transporter permease subunit [Aetokthonos hydrillicola CCALA 1050]MBW4584136.1 efflux RND transporter permease subunit [Aetokthonos hydrillicola CCALA 1050]MDR9898330.1 efflux RND transporter permease subunit [Aetokthonos hydrillicola Thurmond2011]